MKEQLDRIEAKLDKVIKAMQEYDGLDEDFNEPKDEYGRYKGSPCTNHDEASWEEEIANKRLDIIGQNGNEGLHYDKEKVIKATKEFGKKKAKEVKDHLKDATFNNLPDFQHTPPPPSKPKRKYYHNKKKK
jgi:hypothetical protein